jgi:hypothetical protein
MQTVHSDHSRLDERSLAMHRLVAAKVQADPALLEKARQNVRRWQESDGSPNGNRFSASPSIRSRHFSRNAPNARPGFANPARSRVF